MCWDAQNTIVSWESAFKGLQKKTFFPSRRNFPSQGLTFLSINNSSLKCVENVVSLESQLLYFSIPRLLRKQQWYNQGRCFNHSWSDLFESHAVPWFRIQTLLILRRKVIKANDIQFLSSANIVAASYSSNNFTRKSDESIRQKRYTWYFIYIWGIGYKISPYRLKRKLWFLCYLFSSMWSNINSSFEFCCFKFPMEKQR